jgi:hypothetical protein
MFRIGKQFGKLLLRHIDFYFNNAFHDLIFLSMLDSYSKYSRLKIAGDCFK